MLFSGRRVLLWLESPFKNLIHNSHIQSFLSSHEIIPLHQLLNFIQRQLFLARQMPLINLIQLRPHPQNLLGVNRNVARLPKVTPRGLMDHDRRVRQAVPLPSLSTAQQQRAHTGCLSNTYRGHGRLDISHGIVDGQARSDGPAWRVDVEMNRLFGVVGFEEEELRDDRGREGFVDFAIEADDALFEQPREDVICD